MYRILVQIIFILWTALCSTAVVMAALFDYRHSMRDGIVRCWAKYGLKILGIEVTRSSGTMQQDGVPYIVMSNHQSNLDILVLTAELPFSFRFITKIELFFIPIFGMALLAFGHIPIRRGNHDKAIRSMKKAAEKVRNGTTVLIFPEGTRCKDPNGPMLPLKKGGFVLAIESGVPILPVGVSGTGQCWGKGSLISQSGCVSYRIGEPIQTKGVTIEQKDALLEKVREAIENLRQTGTPSA